MDQANIRVAVYQEGDAWIAQCLDYDICAQAPDVNSLQERFNAVLRADLMESVERSGTPFGGIGPAPEYIRRQHAWSDGSFTTHGSVQDAGGGAVGYEMALCA